MPNSPELDTVHHQFLGEKARKFTPLPIHTYFSPQVPSGHVAWRIFRSSISQSQFAINMSDWTEVNCCRSLAIQIYHSLGIVITVHWPMVDTFFFGMSLSSDSTDVGRFFLPIIAYVLNVLARSGGLIQMAVLLILYRNSHRCGWGLGRLGWMDNC